MSNRSPSHQSQIRPVPPEIIITSDDLEASESLSQSEKSVLQVIDAPFDGTQPQVRAVFSFQDDIAEGMKGLPPHSSGTARIFDVTIHSDFVITGLRDTKGPERTRLVRDALSQFLEAEYGQPIKERRIFGWLHEPLLVNDIGSISSQWSQRLGGGDGNFYRLVNRTSLQQDPLDYELRPRDSYLTCAQDVNDRLIGECVLGVLLPVTYQPLAIIVNDVWSKQVFRGSRSRRDDISFQNPRSVSNMLAGNSWSALSDGSLDTFIKLLILDFFHASIYLQRPDYYGSLIYPALLPKDMLKFSPTNNPHLRVPSGLFEPRLSDESSEAFKEIADVEAILRSVDNLVDSVEFVVAALDLNYTAGTGSARKSYERYIQELKGLCLERRNNAHRALEALNRQLGYLAKRDTIRDGKSVKMLTILASLYLPLSLSASLLGMQSPFKAVVHTQSSTEDWDGTNLMFDFFGVFIALGTGTIIILYGIKLGLWLRLSGLDVLAKTFSSQFSIFSYGKRWRFGGLGGQFFELIRVATTWWLSAGVCITLLVIFLAGMFSTPQMAWDSAKWMFATYLVVSGVLVGCCTAIYHYLHHERAKAKWGENTS